MSYDLTDLHSFVTAFFVIAGVTALLAVAGLTEFFASNRKVRIERHATIPAYYGNLLGAH